MLFAAKKGLSQLYFATECESGEFHSTVTQNGLAATSTSFREPHEFNQSNNSEGYYIPPR